MQIPHTCDSIAEDNACSMDIDISQSSLVVYKLMLCDKHNRIDLLHAQCSFHWVCVPSHITVFRIIVLFGSEDLLNSICMCIRMHLIAAMSCFFTFDKCAKFIFDFVVVLFYHFHTVGKNAVLFSLDQKQHIHFLQISSITSFCRVSIYRF